jgi:diguanylate cyclase (GGDEF)-like protein
MIDFGTRAIARYIAAIQWFIPLAVQHDAAQLTRAQNVINAVLMAALAGPFYAAAYAALGFGAAATEILLCCAVMFAAPFLMRLSGSILIAREVFLCAVFFNFTWLTFHLGGVDAPTVGWLITGPVVAMFLGGVTTAVFWLAMSCMAVGVLYALRQNGVELPAHPVNDMPLLYLICNLGLYIVVVVFVLMFELTKTQGFVKLERALKIINELAIRDELTGSHNRRHLIKLIESEKERTALAGPFCLCLLDIDFFKRINDTYGHQAGDTVLRQFALTVQSKIRDSDSFGRYGGEEFLLMLPATGEQEAVVLSERVRVAIERLAFADISDQLNLTVSIGIAEFRAGESIGQTVARADEALYSAKSNGRNRIMRFGQEPEAVLAADGAPSAQGLARAFAPAQTDPLTGLLNRRVLRDRLGHAMERATRHDRMVVLMLLNVNKFKEINDAFGYEAGDNILIHCAAKVRATLRESDTLARWGGDEFVVILEDVALESDAQQVAEKILNQFAMPLQVDGRECFVTLSIGMACFPGIDCDLDALLKHADIAMMRAKDWGDNMVQLYSAESSLPPSERLGLKNGLREALGGNQLFLEYQPQIDLASGRMVGVEALIRWQHPQRGLLLPAHFVAIAEECGLIVPIGRWVLREACAQACAWRDAGLQPVTIAVNSSALEFRARDFLENLRNTLVATSIEPGSLELELTESVLMQNVESSESVLFAVASMGIKLAIDDFGTGYSSLSYLSRFPINTLKIDQSFVREISGSPDNSTIVSAIINMGRSLKRRVIAEGVETRDQHEFLLRQNCDEGQGDYYSPPMPAREFEGLLQAGAPLVAPVWRSMHGNHQVRGS